MQKVQNNWKMFDQEEDNSSGSMVCSLQIRIVFSRKNNVNIAALYSPAIPKPADQSCGRKPNLLAAHNITQLAFNLQEMSLEFQSITLY